MRIARSIWPRIAAALLALIIVGTLPAVGSSPNSAIFYVALDGNDAWSGKLAAPNIAGTDGPFASLTRARKAIRTLKSAGGAPAACTVMIRGGKYFLHDPLVLTGDDSGNAQAPTTYQAYPGERPVLSGGRPVTGWKTYRGQILMAKVPGAKGGKWKARQLFLNGKRQTRSRWPNLDPSDPMYGGWLLMQGPGEKGSITSFQYEQGALPHHWAKPSEGEVEFYMWNGQWRSTVPIQSIDTPSRTIRLTHSGVQFDMSPWYLRTPLQADNPFYVVNLLEELDQPGEWCFDSENGRVYFWPPTGKLEATDEVVVPMQRNLIDIDGASWVNISGLTFTETMDGDNFHHEGMQGVGPMFPQANWQFGGDALHMKNAEHCTIEGNRFVAVGGNAVYLEGYNYRNAIHRNEISDAGANGICLLGTIEKHPLFNRVEDNSIRHVGVLNKYVAGIFLGVSDGNIVGHNLMEDLPHHAINLSNNPWGRNIVEYNVIRRACQEIMDTGAINSWMEQTATPDSVRAGHIIRFNYIADAYGFQTTGGKIGKGDSEFTNGIYLDNYTSNCLVYGNVIVRCRNGIMIHAGRNNVIENNVIVNCWANYWIIDAVTGSSPFYKDMVGFLSGNYLWRNIYYQTRPDAVFMFIHNGWSERTFADSDHNLIYHNGPEPFRLEDRRGVSELEKVPTLTKWKALGYDTHSVEADPLFVDPAHDNYRLKPESPAFTLGFSPIDMDRMGPRK